VVAVSFRFLERHGTAYMVMEFIRGQNFLEWMRAHPKPTEQLLKSILVPLLDGLGYLHREGVLHRDISPENIFVTEQGRPMLLDFGSARATIDRHSALTGVVRPGYSPIEQYQTVEPQGPFTDLYALAGVTIHAITGRVPPLSMDRLGNLDPFETLKQRYRSRYHESFLNALEVVLGLNAVLGRLNRNLVADLGASNGVFVRGKRVEQTPLENGDIIELGEVRLRFTLNPSDE
jgi:serine/threonine protein kinase